MHKRLHKCKIPRFGKNYVADRTGYFFFHFISKCFRLCFLFSFKNRTGHRRAKNFCKFFTKLCLYEFFPKGNTVSIFILQEGVCRER